MGLNPYNIWQALFALFGVVLILPATFNWVLPQFYSQPDHVVFLATMVPPFLLLFLGASYLEPG